MKYAYISFLKCIKCAHTLSLLEKHCHHRRDSDIEFGVLCCSECKTLYPIIDGVGIFFPENLVGYYFNEYEKEMCLNLGINYNFKTCNLSEKEKKQIDVSRNWSYQWNKIYGYSKNDLEKEGFFSEELFYRFIPIRPSDLTNKIVIIWCGGKGREAYHVAKYKPHMIIVNEIGDEIYGIREIVGEANLLLIRCDMKNNPLINGFADYSICDHALQHVGDHSLGFKKMLDVLKPGAVVAMNVYSYENNFLLTHVIEPLKFILHKLPISLQHKIAFLPAIAIYCLIHFVYVPASNILPERFCRRLPLFDHMIFWSKDILKFIWTACFDLIHAPVSHHFNKTEIEEMADLNQVDIIKLINTHGTTWSLVGKTKA